MARTVSAEINGTEYHMPASYAASREIAETVGDPLKMAINEREHGPANWTTDDVVDIIHIGVKHAGCGLTRDAIGESVVEKGVVFYMEIASNYIASMVSGGPEKPVSGQKKAPARSRGSK